MSLKLYMDVHVPFAIVEALRRREVDVLTAQEDGTERLADPDLLDRATELGRILFTRDEDFLAVGAQRQATGTPFGGVVYAHQLQVSIGQCVGDLEVLTQAGKPDDIVGKVLYLPLQ